MSDAVLILVSALAGAFGTYLFAAAIERRRDRYRQQSESQRRALNALQAWRGKFMRHWMGTASGQVFPGVDLMREAEQMVQGLIEETRDMASWRARRVRQLLVLMAGDSALLVHWLGPAPNGRWIRDDGDNAWFGAFINLGGHFGMDLLNEFARRSERFRGDREEDRRALLRESNRLERLLHSRWYHVPFLGLPKLEKTERKGLKTFGYLGIYAWHRRLG
jgi:hypothetical protein